MNIATGQEARPPEVDMFAQTFSVAAEKQEKAADEATEVLLKRFEGNPDIEKARAEFERAQEVEERFHQDFPVPNRGLLIFALTLGDMALELSISLRNCAWPRNGFCHSATLF